MDVKTSVYGWFGAGWEGDGGLAREIRVGGGASAKVVDIKLHGWEVRLVYKFKAREEEKTVCGSKCVGRTYI